METNYLNSARKQFLYYKSLAEKTFDQLDEKDLFWKPHPEVNSIAVIVNHLSGNMKSRWTGFLTSDGEKEWRNRDLEFEDIISSKQELDTKWQEGWKCLFEALSELNLENFYTTVYIRNQSHAVVDAINRQIAHYAYHVGQIVFIGKMIKGQQWKSLSIAKGKSTEYNYEKFSLGKHDGHFTDDFLNVPFS